MKTLRLTATLVLLLIFAASPGSADAKTNYVIIGVFKNMTNAVHYTDAARAHHVDANYALNKVRLLYFVFVLQTDSVQIAIQEVLKLRASSEYTGAWVYHGVLGEGQVHDGVRIDLTLPLAQQPVSAPAPEVKAPADSVVTKREPEPAAVAAEVPVVVAPEMPDAGEAADPKAMTKVFVFKIYTPDKSPKAGNIEVIDIDREKKVTVLKANEPVIVKAINNSGDLRFDCQVAGYRRVTQTINFKNPATSETGVTIEGNAIIVPFELVRLKKGDKEILYNIYFYKDAAIMRPESKYELDELLAMMNENVKYRIKIHGHTNGKASGKIIEMGDSRNFFSLSGSKDGFGSAKKLSEERAVLIREYLASEGIAADRMEIKAWGGKKPIYAKDHAQASSNVRVEVEILQD